jgi:hypothetical protein
MFTKASGSSTPTERMRIDSSGTVSITNESSDGLIIERTGTTTGKYRFGIGGTNLLTIRDVAQSETRMAIDSSGNVGIGTTSPSGKLNIEASGNHLHLRADTATAGKYWNFDVTSANQLYIINNANTGYLTIKDDGNVGIGTTTPSQQLELGGIASPALKFTSTGTNGGVIIFNVAGADKGFFGSGYHLGTGSSNDTAMRGEADLVFLSGGNNQRMRIDSGGQLFLFSQTSGAGNATLKYTTGTGAVTYDTSSRLVKDEIETIPYGLDTVLKLAPKRYIRNDSDNKLEIGFIADEVQKVVPELVGMMEKKLFTKNVEDTEMIAGSVEYEKITAILVKAIQELKAEVDKLKQECKCKN